MKGKDLNGTIQRPLEIIVDMNMTINMHFSLMVIVLFFSNMYCLKTALQMVDPLYVVPCIGAQYRKALLSALSSLPYVIN